ncbi:MAG: TonB-dependent receptor [Bacteroidales bacterium]|nr:TonB-dependent receptor [Bacteroidales bacterium]
MKQFVSVLILLSITVHVFTQQKYTVSGYITDDLGEELIGATVLIPKLSKGAITNTYGFYSLTLPEGKYEIEISFVGYLSENVVIQLDKDQKMNFSLEESSEMIESVEIVAEGRDVNIREVEMSTNTLQMRTIQKLPMFMGETDVIKTIQLLPGVLSSNEATGGFHVRGGGTDQNLILLDNAPVYNASHAIGFLSVFNADAIKDMKLYKGGIPPEYGGRLSSILDIHMKEGNKNEFHGTAGVGTITSRLTLEGPVVPGKVSFLISGRRTYFDLFLPFAEDSMARESNIYFYDLNAKINYSINDNNRVFLSGYFGRDVVKFGDMLGMDYGNFTVTARWNHVFNQKLFMNVSTMYSNYNYTFNVTEGFSQVNWITYIRDVNQLLDFTYYLTPENTIKFGAQAILHNFNPGHIYGQYDDTSKFDLNIPNNYSLEYGLYVSNEQEITSRLTLLYGLRYSFFQNIGPGQSLAFDKTDPENYVDTITHEYDRGETYNIFPGGLEPRLSVRYTLNTHSSLKASYNRMYQYIHLASNSTASLPLDFWFPSSPNIKPQKTDQVALGYFRNFKDNVFETSVEVFYKWNTNTIDFRDHAQLLLNEAYEGELRIGKGKAYGVELQVKKQTGKLTGWISYTYSRSFKKIPEIYDGKTYPASYDKPHDFALVVSYDFNDRWNVSGNWIYTSAPPRTMPTGRFEYQTAVAPVYSDRNSIRIFPYHRLDISATFRLNKYSNRFNHFLNLSVYNAYLRKNPIMIDLSQDEDDPLVTKAYMIYLYRIVPSLTYYVNF